MNNHNCSNSGVPRINSTYTPAIACTILFFDSFTRANNPPIIVPKITVIAASQCPFNAKYVPIIENVSKEQNIEFKAIHIDTKEKAQNAQTYATNQC